MKTSKQRTYGVVVDLRKLRGARPRKTVAHRLGHSVATLGRWERGETAPSLPALHRWAKSLGREIRLGPSPLPPSDETEEFTEEQLRAIAAFADHAQKRPLLHDRHREPRVRLFVDPAMRDLLVMFLRKALGNSSRAMFEFFPTNN